MTADNLLYFLSWGPGEAISEENIRKNPVLKKGTKPQSSRRALRKSKDCKGKILLQTYCFPLCALCGKEVLSRASYGITTRRKDAI